MNKLTVITHNINESVVEQRKLDGYINATALTSAYKLASGKRRDVSEWLSNKRTQESLKHLSSKTGIPIESLYKVVRGSPETGGGTWIHPQLADNFRKHLDLKPNNQKEQVIRDLLVYELGTNVQTEVVVFGNCKVDIVTPTEIIEVKSAKRCHEALGQILVYGQAFPQHKKRVHIFGRKNPEMIKAFELACVANNISVTWE
jgi:hypothetical protein